MRQRSAGIWMVSAVVVVLLAGAGAYGQPAATDSLYKRLGGYDAIAAVVDDFIPRLATDKELSRFFDSLSTSSVKRVRQLVVDLICKETGGPCEYLGRSMKDSHTGLGISGKEFEIGANHLVASLDKFKVPKKEKDELIAIVSKLMPDIVEKP